mgnify:CR=1 FL=1
MENKIDITKLKAQDFMNELPEMVRSLEAVRSGSQDKKPVEVTFGELVTGKSVSYTHLTLPTNSRV